MVDSNEYMNKLMLIQVVFIVFDVSDWVFSVLKNIKSKIRSLVRDIFSNKRNLGKILLHKNQNHFSVCVRNADKHKFKSWHAPKPK